MAWYVYKADADSDGSITNREFEDLLVEFMLDNDLVPLEFSDIESQNIYEMVRRM